VVEVAPDQLVEQMLLRRSQQVAAGALGQQAGVGPRIGPGEDVVGATSALMPRRGIRPQFYAHMSSSPAIIAAPDASRPLRGDTSRRNP
jgi:hypothetical protein